MVNIGTNYHLICSLSLKICVSSFRNPYLSDHHLFGSSEMKTIGPTRFVPPGPSLSSMSSQHFFTGRMHQIRAAHCVQHALHRQIVECSNSTNILIPLGETLMVLIKVIHLEHSELSVPGLIIMHGLPCCTECLLSIVKNDNNVNLGSFHSLLTFYGAVV